MRAGNVREWPLRSAAVGLALVTVLVGACRDSAGLHGTAAPASHAGDARAVAGPTGASPAAPTGMAGQPSLPPLPRGSVSEAEALRPRPDLPAEARALT